MMSPSQGSSNFGAVVAQQVAQKNDYTGFKSSLSFTRCLLEETQVRNERLQKSELKAQSVIGKERDITSVSVSIQSNLLQGGAG